MTQSGQTRGINSNRIFYGWWIVLAAFLNLFFAVGIIFYGFPVFYPSFVASLGFSHAQITQGFLFGFLVVGLPFGLLTGWLIDRVGARWVILVGVILTALPLFLMGYMTQFWQYELLCIVEVMGYTLAGPISNQVLISQWFHLRRGRAMGYAYLGLGVGGVVSPVLANLCITHFGWRHALEIAGVIIFIVLFPIGLWITRSQPADMGLTPDGLPPAASSNTANIPAGSILSAVRSLNFWLIVIGASLVIGPINAVIQHFILAMKTQGYSIAVSARYLSILLAASLCGRVLVGYFADYFNKKNTMALYYMLIGAAIPLLIIAHHPTAALAFTLIFGFAMGADYMLIPLVTAECFGIQSLGKLLALVIMAYSIGQWMAPWIAGRIFDTYHSYTHAWVLACIAGLLGSAAIYAIRVPKKQ